MIHDLQPSRILLVKLSSFGDVVRTTPCIRALRSKWPDVKISFAIDRNLAPLLASDPNIHELIANTPGGVVPAIRSALGHRGYDLAIDFQGTHRSAVWMYMCGARLKAGRGKWRPGWKVAVPDDLSVNDVQDQAKILQQMGIPVPDLNPQLHIDKEADSRMVHQLREHEYPERGFLVINPFGRWQSKTWPAERYAEVIKWFVQKFSQRVIITGSSDEKLAAAKLLSMVPRGAALSFAGSLTLSESMALYQRAALMLTGDSGPMHAAAALDTRVIALFGPTWPERSAPWGKQHVVIQSRRPDNHHAYRSRRDQTYIKAIEISTVCDALMSNWKS